MPPNGEFLLSALADDSRDASGGATPSREHIHTLVKIHANPLGELSTLKGEEILAIRRPVLSSCYGGWQARSRSFAAANDTQLGKSGLREALPD